MVGLAMANYASSDANAHSIAFDGMAFDETEQSQDMLIVEAGEGQGSTWQSSIGAAARLSGPRGMGQCLQKARLLQLAEVEPPFVRAKARRQLGYSR